MKTDFTKFNNTQLDHIYYQTVGYRPIEECGQDRETVIEILNEFEVDGHLTMEFIPMFKIYKKEAHPNGPVTIFRKVGEPFDEQAKRVKFSYLGHQIIEL